MSSLWLEDPLGVRPLSAADLPLSVGGPGTDIVVPGCAPFELRARVTVEAGGLRVVPEPGAIDGLAGVGIRLDEESGRQTIVVTHGGVANLTQPPLAGHGDEDPGEQGDDRGPIPVIAYEPRAPRRARRRRLRGRVGFVLWPALGLVALVVAYLFTAATVVVATTPAAEPESVDFRGTAFELGFGDRWLLPPGDYELEVVVPGYRTARQPLQVVRGTAQEVIVGLERLPGLVAFDTGGIAATLVVDGIVRGDLPGEFELEAGTRELAIRAPRHVENNLRLEVTGGGERQAVSVALQPGFAAVTVQSVPAGARVLADGRELGQTPLTTELDAGRYTLAIVHPQFRRFESQVTVQPGKPLLIGPVELGLPDGRLVLRSSPIGADVSVGGQYRGRTPLAVALAPGLPQEVLVSKAGFAPATRTVRVESGRESVLALELEAVLGEIRVSGEPADAELFIDGVSRGPANQALVLPAAPHQLEVRKAGLATFRSTVLPQAGQPQLLEYRLSSPEAARRAGLPQRVTTALGGELLLVNGGRFLMGSPRREAGRRSNEAERNVLLRRPFYLARHPVTNREFREFRAEHLSGIFREETLDLERQPVVRVGWQDAAAFCNWLSEREKLVPSYQLRDGRYELIEPATTGYRLPTEAEWEFAARHDGQAARRRYPWGDALPVAAGAGNWADVSAIYLTPVTISGYNDGFRVAAPVGSFAASALGFHDLGANVFEWTTDRYSIYVVGPDHVATDPVGPRDGDGYVIRGAGWLTGKLTELRLAARDVGVSGRPDLGFRLARYAE